MRKNNGKNNGKQRGQLGGVTGRGFMPGQSGNPAGRPRTRGLLRCLKDRLSDRVDDGATIEELLVSALVWEALHGKHRLQAIMGIFDRVEGRPCRFDPPDLGEGIEKRSLDELTYYQEHRTWPTAEELIEYKAMIAKRGRPTFVTTTIYPDEIVK